MFSGNKFDLGPCRSLWIWYVFYVYMSWDMVIFWGCLIVDCKSRPTQPSRPPPDALSANAAYLSASGGMYEIIFYMDESRHPW